MQPRGVQSKHGFMPNAAHEERVISPLDSWMEDGRKLLTSLIWTDRLVKGREELLGRLL